jgi:hypothetical protein
MKRGDLTQMLLRLVHKIEWKSEQRLEEWYEGRQDQTDSLIRTFRDALIVHGSADDPAQKIARLETLYTKQGGRDKLEQACAEHLRHEQRNSRAFARAAFVPLRTLLLRARFSLRAVV